MKPSRLKSKIFGDSGDPEETAKLVSALGFLDGQTTNPSLVLKNPEVQARLAQGKKFSSPELIEFYKSVVQKISAMLPDGSISMEVYADRFTGEEQMLEQAREMFSWIPNAHIKLPITPAGLEAAEKFVAEGGRVNMTLCFTQEQAAAVYVATRGAKRGDVFVSPFVGRLDDRGENGMDLIKNILSMYGGGDGHVEVLTASVRSLSHHLYSLALGSDIITAPAKVLLEWAEKKIPVPDSGYVYDSGGLSPIGYKELDPEKPWRDFNVSHELTDKGIDRFAADWNSLIV